MTFRLRLVVLGITVYALFLWARASYLQLTPQARLENFRHQQFERVVTLQPRRGDILDRNGLELATSVTAYSVFVDPSLVKKKGKTAKGLARLLGLRYNETLSKVSLKDKKFVWIERRISSEVKDQLLRLKLKGVGVVEEPKRIYPNDQIISALMGYVGQEGTGLEGLELKFDSQLRGDTKKLSMQRDARGRPLISNGQIFSEPPEGEHLRLTIERELQYKLEHELMQALLEHQADNAMGVILDPRNGEVLAMANVPNFNPNFPQRSDPEMRRNRVITDPFEPGSTLKTFTIAAGLRAKAFSPNTLIDCEQGRLKIGKRTIREADEKHRFGLLTVNEILQHSSNVGSTKLALKLGTESIRQSLVDFGFGQKTGIGLPGESKGILPGLPWNEHLLANVSFGHGVAATVLQVANAYATIANGGILRSPKLLLTDSSKDSGGDSSKEITKETRVLPATVAGQMTFMLLGATGSQGTGVKARVPGFQVAGKTGTSQKVSTTGRGYLPNAYISSFAGYLPAHDPRFVIYVVIDNPQKGYYGSDVAAPVFARVARFAVQRTDLVPNLLTENDVRRGLFTVQENSQPRRARAKVVESSAKLRELAPGEVHMPDLSGLTLVEVMEALRTRKLQAAFSGQGRVLQTSPEAGTPVAEGAKVRIELGGR
jgi:cell division protein FtsI (penicillin-binding protein 3)